MGITFNNFAIRGIDVSGFNDVFDWNKAKESGVNFSGIRVGYGRTTDVQFKKNWTNAKGKVLRMPYWYLDYYSNHDYTNKDGRLFPSNGLSDEEWGAEQANNCWNIIKNDPDCSIVWLDIESGLISYSPVITTVPTRVYAIAKAFLERMDILNGKFNGIYCSLGLLSWFSSWFRNRPLWVAWYNESQTISSVIRNVTATGWTGKCLIWQYASDGDSDDNGTPDGKSMGMMQYDFLDLNGWVGTQEQYAQMFSTSVEAPDPIETPDDEVIVTPPTNTRVIQIKESTRTLTLRKKPLVSWLTQIRTYPAGTKFDCLEKVTVGANTWQRVGIDQYIADNYDGIQYLK